MTSDRRLTVEDSGGGALLRLRVSAGAGHNAITGAHDGALKVAVVQAPEKGRANREVQKLLAKTLGVRTSDIEIVRGATSRKKTVFVHGVNAESLRSILVPFAR